MSGPATTDAGHDWHTFDVERHMEVAREGDVIYLRYTDQPSRELIVLTPEEFEQLRSPGPDPRGVD